MPWCISPVPSRIPCALLGRAMRQVWCRLKSWRGHLPQRLALAGDRCAPHSIGVLLSWRRNCIADGRRIHERHAETRVRRAMTQLVPRSCGSPRARSEGCRVTVSARDQGVPVATVAPKLRVAMSCLRLIQRRDERIGHATNVCFHGADICLLVSLGA